MTIDSQKKENEHGLYTCKMVLNLIHMKRNEN